ncbi:LytTR family DNA-binding domain-containing protein [Priestia endophytica]|uniref:LytTR family DNA-binding domain-containing protein n=1 Tax=Priestia endophytica TaxID=135735 RepID=UPI00124E3826|nr:LytTR family DNA-binding domain-containing protein [Priestia endophytica]KAB2488210.1 LytTR family transcriptional regulator [Priestia endophytica]
MNLKVENSKLVIMKRSAIYLINFDEILYIERFDRKTIIQTMQKEICVNLSLRKIYELLPVNFVRTHQSYIINKNLIKELATLNSHLYEVIFNQDKIALVKKDRLPFIF